MRKKWILAAVLIAAISTSACGNKATIQEPPEKGVEEPAEPDAETGNNVQQSEDENNEQTGDSDKNTDSIESPDAQEGAFRIPDFISQDFDGNEITNEFFSDNKLTIVNVWTTT